MPVKEGHIFQSVYLRSKLILQAGGERYLENNKQVYIARSDTVYRNFGKIIFTTTQLLLNCANISRYQISEWEVEL
jgi:hypothetical protein